MKLLFVYSLLILSFKIENSQQTNIETSGLVGYWKINNVALQLNHPMRIFDKMSYSPLNFDIAFYKDGTFKYSMGYYKAFKKRNGSKPSNWCGTPGRQRQIPIKRTNKGTYNINEEKNRIELKQEGSNTITFFNIRWLNTHSFQIK